MVFQDGDEVPSADHTVANIVATEREIHAAMLKPAKGPKHVDLIAWHPPTHTVKLNTDGAARGNPGIAGEGGVIRNSEGDWLVGFIAHLGVCSNMEDELHALRLALSLAWQEGYRSIICEIVAG